MSNINSGKVRDLLPWTTHELKQIRCPCGCEEVMLSATCHSNGRLLAFFDHREQVLILLCSVCQGFVAKIKVDRGEAPPPSAMGGARDFLTPSRN